MRHAKRAGYSDRQPRSLSKPSFGSSTRCCDQVGVVRCRIQATTSSSSASPAATRSTVPRRWRHRGRPSCGHSARGSRSSWRTRCACSRLERVVARKALEQHRGFQLERRVGVSGRASASFRFPSSPARSPRGDSAGLVDIGFCFIEDIVRQKQADPFRARLELLVTARCLSAGIAQLTQSLEQVGRILSRGLWLCRRANGGRRTPSRTSPPAPPRSVRPAPARSPPRGTTSSGCSPGGRRCSSTCR